MNSNHLIRRSTLIATTFVIALLLLVATLVLLNAQRTPSRPSVADIARPITWVGADGPGSGASDSVQASSSSCGSGVSGVTAPGSYLSRTHTTSHFRVHYTLDSTNYPDDALSNSSQPSYLGSDLEDAWTAYNSFGFETADLNSSGYIEVYVYDFGTGWGVTSDGWDCFLVKPGQVRTSSTATPKGTPHHEFFHRVQYKYDTEADWLMEGTAKQMEDKVFTSLDDDSSSAYVDRVDTYLADPDMGLKKAGYNAALFWTYFTERYGSSPTSEPGYHSDAMVALWEAAASADGEDAVIDALSALGAGTNFRDLFADFALANYVKEYNYSANYAYVDDDTTPYDDVDIEHGTQSLSNSSPVAFSGEVVSAWGIDYFEATVSASDCAFFNVSADGNSGDEFIYHVVVVSGYDALDRYTTKAEDLTRSYYNDNGNIDRVALVVASTRGGTYDVNMSCLVPSLDIEAPTSTAYAFAGAPENPDNILVMAQATASGSYVEGLESDAFSVQIGGKEASILNAAYVQHQYWILVEPPTQATSTWYSLDVSLGEVVTANQSNAVLYIPRPSADEILVFDISGSMADESKLASAKNAGRLYTDIAVTGDQVGVVSYTTDSNLVLGLTSITGGTKTSIKSIINNDIGPPDANTCIGCGLQTAQDELNANGELDHWWVILLLSDGMENVTPYWEDMKSSVLGTQTIIHTVFLGPSDADGEELMQTIADEANNGTYNRVFLESEGASALALSEGHAMEALATRPLTIALANRIAEVYKGIREETEGYDRLHQEVGLVGGFPPHQNPVSVTVGIDPGMAEAVFTANWPSGGLDMTLRRPNGIVVNPGDGDVIEHVTDATHAVYRVRNPQPGPWEIELSLQSGSELVEYLLIVSGDSDVNLDAYLGLAVEDRWVGTPMPILATLTDREVIIGAQVVADVLWPDGSQRFTIPLVDDGLHGDGSADDGIYGGLVRRTEQSGSYRAVIRATGKANAGYPFVRWKTVYFFMQADQDSNQDGLPDRWAQQNDVGQGSNHPGDDPDNDGLTNDMELSVGTHPLRPDTDGGGERDGSEVARGGNPHDPRDDRIRPPGHIRVFPGNGFNIVRFNPVPSATHYVIYRATAPSLDGFRPQENLDPSAFVPIDTNVPPTGVYTDATVINDTRYIYMMAAVSPQGAQSGFTLQADVTPRADPVPPTGEILINDDDPSTHSPDVVLTLDASADTAWMIVDNKPDFPIAQWEPFALKKVWHLAPEESGNALVYVRFKDESGNISDLYLDSIQLVPGASVYLPLVYK